MKEVIKVISGALVAFIVAFALCAPQEACTPQQVQSALDVVPVISADLCKLAEDVPGMPGWVFAVCDVIDPATGAKTGRQAKFPIQKSSPEAAMLRAKSSP